MTKLDFAEIFGCSFEHTNKRIQDRYFNSVRPSIKNNVDCFDRLNANRAKTVSDFADKELFNVIIHNLNIDAFCDNKAQEKEYSVARNKILKAIQLVKQNNTKKALSILSGLNFGFSPIAMTTMYGKENFSEWLKVSFQKGVKPLTYKEWSEILKIENRTDLWAFLG